jgi:uncharacterized protein (DUF4415 family)
MSKKIVKHVNLSDLPPLTAKQKTQLAALADKPESEIDFSDIPATSAKDWKGAQRGRFYRPIKKQLTVHIDADVLAWLRAQGETLPIPHQCHPEASNARVAQGIDPKAIREKEGAGSFHPCGSGLQAHTRYPYADQRNLGLHLPTSHGTGCNHRRHF